MTLIYITNVYKHAHKDSHLNKFYVPSERQMYKAEGPW